MKISEERKKLREYILGVGDEDRSHVEERLMTDDDYFQKLAMTEEDLIQDYADGKLDAAERAMFEKRFLISEENRQRLKFACALRKYINENDHSPEPKRKPNFFDSLKAFFISPVPAALAVLMILGVVGFFVWNSFSSSDSEVLVALNKAFKNDRPTEARITGFDYAPKTEGTRGNDKNENLDLVFAKSRATETVLKNETAENLHELGRVFLAENNFDEAIKQFEKALRKNPDIAKVHNDLGVALMAKAKTLEEGKIEKLAQANEEFAKAIELDKNLLDAYFNQALVIQSLNLPNQAKEAWEKYLELDPTSAWAKEARENLKIIETNQPISKTKEQVLQEFLEARQTGDHEKAWQTLSRNREMITGKLIPQQLAFLFVDAKAATDEIRAKEYLEALVYVGKLEEENGSDLYWRDMAAYYSNIQNKQIFILKQAQDLVREGNKMRTALRYKDSLNNFAAAKTFFQKIQNTTEEQLCDYWIAVNLYQLNQIRESDAICDKLTKLGETKSYKWLAALSHIRLAYSSAYSQNDYTRAIEHCEQALKYVESINDTYDQHRIFTIIANNQNQLGQYKISLSFSEKSLVLGQIPDSSLNQKWLDYETVTEILQSMRFYSTAAVFQKEALELTQLTGNFHNEQVSNVYLAKIYILQGRFDLANEFVNKSIEIAEKLADREARQKTLAHARLLQGHLKRLEGKYEEAVEILNTAAAFYDHSEYHRSRYNTHKEKFLSYIQIGNDEQIRAELDIILNIFRFHREKILEDQKRSSFFENKQDVYDLAIDYEFAKEKFDTAFDYSEESRARSLLDLQRSQINVSLGDKQPEITFSPNVTEPLKLSQIQAEMPENAQLVEFAVLNDKILIWLITKHDLSVGKTEIPSDELQKKVLTYLDLVSKNIEPEEQRKLSGELYDILINPIKEKLDSGKELFLIPDKVLLRLPFATLFSGRYFIEDYTVSYAPSANVFVFCSKRAKELGAKTSEILLSIGNPAFSQAAFKDLQLLPSAGQEANKVAGFYGESYVFTGKDATKNKVKENLKQADVVHFAGHYLVDEHLPIRSSLILAGNEKEKSSLANFEIISEKFSRPRLIILSACQTGIEQYHSGEGVISAARTFLATGVPLVVASQWKVDSEATSKLMVNFHRLRKNEKLSTAAALRRAQIEMLQREDYQQPYFWAAFTSLGGYSNF